MRIASAAWIVIAMLFLGTTSAQAQFTVADTLKAVAPGLVYKEFSRVIPTSNDLWRVTDPNATFVGDPANSPSTYLPNAELPFTVDDLQGAIKAVAVIDCWGGHVGTIGKQFRLNDNSWINVPDISNTPSSPECYTYQFSVEVEVPIEHLLQGINVLEGTSGGQTCYSFNWGQWGWYGFLLRVYYDPALKTPPTGSITSPVNGATIGQNPTFAADASSGAGVSRVEFVGYYDDFDADGDGVYLDWQQSYHRLRNDSTIQLRHHLGTAGNAPYSITWDESWIPDQQAGGIKAVARIRDGNGLWYVTDQVTGLTLDRPGVNVKIYRAANAPQSYWVRDGATKSSNFIIPTEHDLTSVQAARIHVATWNGINGQAEAGQDHWTKVNGWTAPLFGEDHSYSYDQIDVPANALQNGSNTVTFYSESIHHGAEILWPGPGMIVRYQDSADTPAVIASQPTGIFVVEGSSATFSVIASGAAPLTYQWQRDAVDIPGATSALYMIPQVVGSDDGTLFRCVVTNVNGSDTSDEALLTVLVPGQRSTAGQIVLYGFDEGFGDTVRDLSGVGAPADLIIHDPGAVSWVAGALSVDRSAVIASPAAVAKLSAGVKLSNEITVEAWVKPANLTQNGPARIVTVSPDPSRRNITIGQGVYGSASDVIEVRARSTVTDLNGLPGLSSPAGSLNLELTHVMFTRNAIGLTKLYINGAERSTGSDAGDLSNWDDSYRMGLANELTGDRPWLGEFHLVALFDRALGASEAAQNFAAGPDLVLTPSAPGIVAQPQDRTVIEGTTATFSVVANGTQPLSYQWQQNEVDIPGATASSYTTGPVTVVDDHGTRFRCLVSNDLGSVISDVGTLSVQVPGARVAAGLQALYGFGAAAGTVVQDISGVGEPMDLTISDPGAVTWLPGGGLSLDAATIVRSVGPATKLIDAAASTNAMTVEAWLTPASTAQNGPARIVTCSADPVSRNFTLGQGVHNAGDDRYVMRLRTTATSNNGTPEVSTAVGSLTPSLTHVVYTRDATGVVTIYLNGDLAQSGFTGGTCSNWDASSAFALGNELTEDRPWLGAYFLVAVYDRALSVGEIGQNLAAGAQSQPVPSMPVITSLPVTDAAVGQPYVYDVAASGYPAPAYALTTAPTGMTIDPATGVIDWTPVTEGIQDVEISVTNSEGFDYQAFAVTVLAAPNVAPTAMVTSPVSGAVITLGDPVSLAATATDTDGTVVQVEFLVDGTAVATVAAPPWEAVWNSGTAGSHLIIARALDNEGTPGDSPAVPITIDDPNAPARVTGGLLALYDFAVPGGVVPDVSGVGSPLDLTIGDEGAVTWLPGGGLSLDTATIVRSAGPATKLLAAAASTNAITVEAWLTPASTAQNGPARIVTCSADPYARNFTLGQGVYNGGGDRYVMRLRTTATSNNGTPEVSTPMGSLQPSLTHVVYTRDAAGAVKIYLNGGLAQSGSTGGTSSNWDAGYAFALGNELTEDRPWLGAYFLVAVYDRALSVVEIGQNLAAGPQGQPVPLAPLIVSAPAALATEGEPYVYDVAAAGYPAPVFTLVTAPTGMTIDAATGVIDWTPDATGDQAVEVSANNSEGADNQVFTVTVYPVSGVLITVWHGPNQRVGHLGLAQPDFNILGNVSPVAELSSLAYQLNGGPFQGLTIGPDTRRLVDSGDFNVDIPTALLQVGANTVTIRAIETSGQTKTAVVNVTLQTGGQYTLPATINWSGVTDPQDVGQYVDGLWQLEGGALRAKRPGYDRIFLIGDENWQDYEVLVPITINAVYPGTAGLGILMRFTGHVVGGHRSWPAAQPKWGYQPFGGIGWLRWQDGAGNNPTKQFYHGDYDTVDDFGFTKKQVADLVTLPFGAEEQTKGFGALAITLGNTYWMRMRCETKPDAPDGDGVTLYSWKIWEEGTGEPSVWSWQVTQESQYALRRGGVALLAHHVDATFGDVQITDAAGVSILGEIAAGLTELGDSPLPKRFELYQNYPNPFNPSTLITLDVPREAFVGVRIYDLQGRNVRELFAGVLAQGTQNFRWDGRHDDGRAAAGGVYLLRLESVDYTSTRKMILLR